IVRFLGLEPAWPEGVLDRRWNVTEPKRAPRGAVRELKRLPGWRRFRRRLPTGIKDGIRTVTHRQHPPPEIPEAAVQDLRARLADDVAALCEGWLGAHFDGWGLLDSRRNADRAGVD